MRCIIYLEKSDEFKAENFHLHHMPTCRLIILQGNATISFLKLPVNTKLSFVEVHTQTDSQHERIGNQRGAAITDEGERKPNNRQQSRCAPDIDEKIDKEHPRHPHNHNFGKVILMIFGTPQ